MEKTGFWAEKIAENIIRRAERIKGTSEEIVCASGISPSGNIHLGNLREIMTVHIVVETLKNWGCNARHIHSWDDYDRLRKVPAGVPESFSEHIGKPLSEIPDPDGAASSYAERFMADFQSSMQRLGIFPEYIRQSEAYKSGRYNDMIKKALGVRQEIFDILSQYQTREGVYEQSREERRAGYFPVSIYCKECGRDMTTVTHYDPSSLTIAYKCNACICSDSLVLNDRIHCKLVWKVDWPMRWTYEGVDFEPGGEDHSSPGSSFTVGKDIVKLFNGHQPSYVGYAFVGMSGRSKISSSSGGVPDISNALDIFEPVVLRWLYVKRKPGSAFKIDFGKEMIRVYEEWDRFAEKFKKNELSAQQRRVFEVATTASGKKISATEFPLPFRFLASSADITQGSRSQILNAARQSGILSREFSEIETLEPRLRSAITWATNYMPEDERTIINTEPDAAYYETIPEIYQKGLNMLLERLEEHWEPESLTTLVYGIPKLLAGLPINAKPTPEVTQMQRAFFVCIYKLICGTDTAPRIPTLFHSMGIEKIKLLLLPPKK